MAFYHGTLPAIFPGATRKCKRVIVDRLPSEMFITCYYMGSKDARPRGLIGRSLVLQRSTNDGDCLSSGSESVATLTYQHFLKNIPIYVYLYYIELYVNSLDTKIRIIKVTFANGHCFGQRVWSLQNIVLIFTKKLCNCRNFVAQFT